MTDDIDVDHPLARTWWRHTKKAIQRGECEFRRFAVVGTIVIDDATFLLAWKCELDGLIHCDRRRRASDHVFLHHPAYAPDAVLSDVDLFALGSENGSMPTATFRPNDSLYERIPSWGFT